MGRWQRKVDQLVGSVIGDGDVSHLPGAGKRLDLGDNANTPDEWRMAFKIMRENEVAPAWITAGKALETREAQLRSEIAREATRFVHAQSPAQARWLRAVSEFQASVARYNSDALRHNLKLPPGIPHWPALKAEALVEAALRKARSRSAT